MNCKVEMSRFSKENPETNFKAEYVGNYFESKERFSFRYHEDKITCCSVLLVENEVVIKREGETRSTITLNTSKDTTAIIQTPFGEIELTVDTYEIVKKGQELKVAYALYEGKNKIDEVSVSWAIKRELVS